MKNYIKLLTIIFCLFTASISYAEQKIVVLDMKFVLNQSKAGKGAQDFLKKTFSDNQKKFASLEKALKKEENDLLEKKSILSKEDYSKKADALRKKVIDYQSQRRAAIDGITSKRAKAKETLLKALDPILSNYIKENDISLVINKINMLGGQPDYDITNFIVEILNKEIPSLNLK